MNPVDPNSLQIPSSSLSFDPVLNNRLWSASQVFLLLWGASKACSYKATVLHLSLHGTWTGKTGFPAHGYSLCFPVCNSFCCGSAGESEVHAVTLGDSRRLEEEKVCSSFPCEENEQRKITTRSCFILYFMSESASSIYEAVNSMHIFHRCKANVCVCVWMHVVEREGGL